MGERREIAALEGRLVAELVARGLRQTGPRRVIARVFFEAAPDEHLGLDEIHSRARKRDRHIGYATVYRTMKLLTEVGLAHERRFGDGFSRYEVAAGAAHHDHLICSRCAGIVEFEEPEIEAIQERVARRHGFAVTSHRHEIYGICASCQKAEHG
ncbi:MAG: transcriptional repressor [Deltaproteobacteria bacterium]|nr:transcriptional repressor [Deltaproteobacteria bacterium]